MKLKLGIPKGSLEQATVELVSQGGLHDHDGEPILLSGD